MEVRCTVGASLGCQCADGRQGAQLCRADGTLATCACTGAIAPCTAGASVECACTDGTRGAQVCGDDGRFQSCVCNPAVADEGLLDSAPIDAMSEVAVDSGPFDAMSEGAIDAYADAGFDAAADATSDDPGDAGTSDAVDSDVTSVDACPLVEPEWCDGRDNDCDGQIDDGGVCPDGTVANTAPFT